MGREILADLVVEEALENLCTACCEVFALGMALPALRAVVLKFWTVSMKLLLGHLFLEMV